MKHHFNYQDSYTSISSHNWCNYAPLLCSIFGLKLDTDIELIMNLDVEEQVDYKFTVKDDHLIKLITLHSQKVYVNTVPNIYVCYTIVKYDGDGHITKELELASEQYDKEIYNRYNSVIS